MIAKVLLNPLPVHLNPEFLLQPSLDSWLGCLEESLVLRQLQVRFVAPADVINRGLGLRVLVQWIFLAEDEHPQYFQFFVEMVELTQAIGQRVDELHVSEELSDAELREFHRPEEPSIALLHEQMMQDDPLMIVIEQPLCPPLLRVVPELSDDSLEEGQQPSVPVIHYSSDVDIPLHVLRVFCDEIRGVDAA